MALVDQKPLPACEKMLYLKHCQEKHALLNSEYAYHSDLALLNERYGNPLIVPGETFKMAQNQ